MCTFLSKYKMPELLTSKPLFPGITDIDQLSRIVRVFGAVLYRVSIQSTQGEHFTPGWISNGY
jgi:hypothetical protein